VKKGYSDPYRVTDGKLSLTVEPVPEALPLNERHYVIPESVRLARVEQRQDVRVPEVRGGANFGEESLGADNRCKVRLQNLDCDATVVLEVLGQVHRGHPSRAQLALDPVASSERCVEANNDRIPLCVAHTAQNQQGRSCEQAAKRIADTRIGMQ
jgi:hypothetical protein